MRQSGSYLSFKKRIQEIFDFAVLVTASVPVTKLNLKLYKDGKINRLPDPDFFEPSVVYEITEHTLNSLGNLGRYRHTNRAGNRIHSLSYNRAQREDDF